MTSSQSLSLSPSRKVERVLTSRPTVERGGVRLKRAFADDKMLDPFLLLDEFHSHNSRDYSAGFPSHPHRGFETVTYMLEGSVEHQDSAGNKGTINAGDVQWMTAGSGIVHQEMPRGDGRGWLWGLQLWVNLPARYKMTEPKYRGIPSDQIPEVHLNPDVKVKLISGTLRGKTGPVRDLPVNCEFLDVTIQPNAVFEHKIPKNHTVFAYILDGAGYFDDEKTELLEHEHTAIFGEGERVQIQAGNDGLRFLLISGEPIGEPVAWQGSVVMNTPEELTKAYEELEQGEFLKPKRK